MVTWQDVPYVNRRGIIRGYRVYYAIDGVDGVGDWKNVSTTADVHEVELTGLQARTTYCIQMAAFTRIGEGLRSTGCSLGITGDLLEGGKCQTCMGSLCTSL